MVQENPLHACVVVADESLHEEPLALDVEAQEALMVRVPGETVGAEVDEAGALHASSVQGAHVEQEVGVATGPVRQVWKEMTSVVQRQIADDEHAPRVRFGDDVRGLLDGLDECPSSIASLVLPEASEARAVVRQRRSAREGAAVREPDRSEIPWHQRGRCSRARAYKYCERRYEGEARLHGRRGR
jgi:hypothetical protein